MRKKHKQEGTVLERVTGIVKSVEHSVGFIFTEW